MAQKTKRCFILVDWWGQVRSEFYTNRASSAGRKSELVLRELEGLIEKLLYREVEQPVRWEVTFRLYAGWMRGGTPTPVLLDYNGLSTGYAKNRRRGKTFRSVFFLPSNIGLARGDTLMADEAGRRRDRNVGVHFPFTSRSECDCPLCNHLNHEAEDGFKCEKTTEKQVDTSIVADAITLAISNEKSKVIVVSNDDDILPGIVAGDALGGDLTLVNTVQKKHLHAQHLSDLILGPKELT